MKAKLKVLEKKRMEDREKLNSLEKVKGERDKFERIIQTLQIKYQPQQAEIAELRRQLKEAEMRLHSVEEMQAEHETAMELATLDREMAEEMAEMYKTELEALKQKTEELELEVEILREENAELTKGTSPEERQSASWLQLEKTNERLREALIRLRDLSQEQEDELRAQIRSMEEDLREYEAVKEQYAVCKESLARSEAAVEDLREQLNNALGAEELIESLTEQNMNQAEEIKELRAIIDDLEALKEINDELEINHIQNEKEMQEEIELKDAIIVEQARQAAQQKEAMEDMEYTLSRFRELVTSLQSDLEDMRASHAVTEHESEQLASRSRAMMDLNMKLQISAAKAQAKAIDLELRRMEAQEAEQHLDIVKLFLPDSFQSDRDSVLALLRFKRLSFKANLVAGFLRERVNSFDSPGHEDDVFDGCAAIDRLTWVACMCDRFVAAISRCDLEQFARYEGALYELEPVERALNAWIDGLRRDDLKEKACADELTRTMALMSHLGEVHFAGDLQTFADDVHMRALLMQAQLESAAVALNAVKSMVQRAVQVDETNDEEGVLASQFAKRVDAAVTQTRSAKVIAQKTVRALEDLRARNLSLTPDSLDAFEQAESNAAQLADMSRRIGADLHKFLHDVDAPADFKATYVAVQNTIARTLDTSDSDPLSSYMTTLRVLTGQITDLSALATDLSHTAEFDPSPTPWSLRAAELRAAATAPADAEAQQARLREELGALRRQLAIKEEDLSTAVVKIETLEARARDAAARAVKAKEVELELEKVRGELAQTAEVVATLEREVKVLEGERDKWKAAAATAGTARAVAAGAASKEQQVVSAAAVKELEKLRRDVEGLQAAVRFLREENRRVRGRECAGMAWLAEPLSKPSPSSTKLVSAELAGEGRAVLGELINLATRAKIPDLSAMSARRGAAEGAEGKEKEKAKIATWRPANTTPSYQLARAKEEWAVWREWERDVLRRGRELVAFEQRKKELVGSLGGERGTKGDRERRRGVARLQIRLPPVGGAKQVGREVRIWEVEGGQEWEGLVAGARVGL